MVTVRFPGIPVPSHLKENSFVHVTDFGTGYETSIPDEFLSVKGTADFFPSLGRKILRMRGKSGKVKRIENCMG
jgi:hypothetical protein